MDRTLPLTAGSASHRRCAADFAALADARWLPWLAFAAAVGLALAINAWGLSATGYGNTYYAAAVRSMTLNWHNFFFGALDPGGFVTVDKPPVFLWVDALSARMFGYSSWSLLLPSAVAGAASVAVLWLIVRRYFGAVAATLAGLVLALTPIWVTVHRLNVPEPFYILPLVGAAYCIMRSLESQRWWAWGIAAGVLVGVAFNTKMLAGWIPGPALALAVVAGIRLPLTVSWRRTLGGLVILALVTLAASASWMLVVDNWPGDRPYVGGSTDNTVRDLVLGYNGLDRVEGMDGAGGAGAPGSTAGAPPGGTQSGAPGTGGLISGDPGPLRMFDAANGAQIGWLLPFGALGGVLSLWRWRSDRLQRAAIVLLLGWLALFGGVFSFAEGIYHSYYTAALAPGVAGLVGIAAVAGRDLLVRSRLWLVPVLAVFALTAAIQASISNDSPGFFDQLQTPALLALGAGSLAIVWLTLTGRPALPAIAFGIAGLLLVPAAWSLNETANASMSTTLPQAGPRLGVVPRSFAMTAVTGDTEQLAAWIASRSEPGARWDLAVPRAMDFTPLIAHFGLSILPLGGFSGRDAIITGAEFADLVIEGEVRYVLASGGGFPGMPARPPATPAGANRPPSTAAPRNSGAAPSTGGSRPPWNAVYRNANAVLIAVRVACTQVNDPALPARYRDSLYDCARIR